MKLTYHFKEIYSRKLGESSSNRTRRLDTQLMPTHSFKCSSWLKTNLPRYIACMRMKNVENINVKFGVIMSSNFQLKTNAISGLILTIYILV